MKKVFFLTGFLLLIMIASAWAAGNFPQPTICDRACWSARDPQCGISQESTYNRAVIHHTASSADWSVQNLEDSKARVRAHQNYHMDSLGWCDIGYHFLTDKLGNNLEGRDGSIPSRPRGAHDGTNSCSIGVSMMGYLHDPYNNDPPSVMRGSVYDVIAWKCDDPFTGYGSGSYGGKTVGYLCGHKDVKATACPGDLMYNPYIGTDVNGGEARDEVYVRVTGGSTPTPTQTPEPDDMYVNDITLTPDFVANKYMARATVWIKGEGGEDVESATVYGDWSGCVSDSVSGDTLGDGKVTLDSPKSKTGGTFTFTVTDVTASGYVYNPVLNVETSDSIENPGGGPTPTPTPTATPTPTPTGTPSGYVYVNDIAMTAGSAGINYYANATVWIKNDSGGDVEGATVYGEWTGAAPGTSEGVTLGDGKVTLRSPNKKNGGTFNFCVTDVVASGYTYDPGMNVETCDSITNP